MDSLKTIGIDEKGYGKVYKVVMRNPSISLTAKAIYAYFCSYAGSGTCAFPRRDKILCDLKINKDTFTKHLNTLIDAKYIIRSRTATGNVYTIPSTVPDMDSNMVEAKTMGYGTVPKLAMLDIRLTAMSKGIYAYLCAYAGSGNSAYPRRNTILRDLNIGINKYYRHYNLLIKFGYITPVQGINQQGKYSSTTYTLNDEMEVDLDLVLSKTRRNCSKRKSSKQEKSTKNTVEKSNTKKSVNGKKEVMSEKRIHGENRAMSEKQVHGKNKSFNKLSTEFSTNGGKVLKAMSEKPISEKTVYPFFGHPYTNNSINNKQSSSVEEDKIKIRAGARKGRSDFPQTIPTQRAKELCHYDHLMNEFSGWSSIQLRVGNLKSKEQKNKYLNHCKKVCDEIVYQLRILLGNKKSSIADKLTLALSDKFMVFDMAYRIAESKETIRSFGGYVRQALINLANEAEHDSDFY